MSTQILSSSEESDNETGLNTKKFSKSKSIILSDEDDGDFLLKENVKCKVDLKATKKKNQLSLLSFAQKHARESSTGSSKDLGELAQCPICFKSVPLKSIEQHADSCADSTSAEMLDFVGSQEDAVGDLYDPEIFDCGAGEMTRPQKRPSWDLQNSFTDPETSSSHPSKRKKTSVSMTKGLSLCTGEAKLFDLAPYPEFQENKKRGCLKNPGNHPGSSIQSFLKKKVPSPVEWTPPYKLSNQSSKEKGKLVTHDFGFKIHPFLAKTSSSSSGHDSGSLKGAVMPDGDGGFIINDSVLDDVSDEESFSLPPLRSNGFIDFQNQFKETSTPRSSTSKRKTKATTPGRSPRKKKWKSWGGKWRGRGRGRGAGRGRRS